MYESLKNRIAALEEEEVLEEEEERKFGEIALHASCLQRCQQAPTAEEAQKTVKGLEENVIHTKYIELVSIRLLLSVHSAYDSIHKVCRAEATGARPRQGEAEAHKGQRCRYFVRYFIWSAMNDVHAQQRAN